MIGTGTLAWIRNLFLESDSTALAARFVNMLVSEAELDQMWAGMTQEQKDNPAAQALYGTTKEIYSKREKDILDPLTDLMATWIDQVRIIAAKYDFSDPATALANGAEMSKDVLALNTAVQGLEFAMGALPNGMGVVASTKVQSMWNWLGLGAVVNAMAHDPIKIALLRPYSDSLEAIYRNRRPDTKDIVEAYRQRSLSTTVITDIDQIDDPTMNSIEDENNTNLYSYLGKWGYKDEWIGIMKDAATRALTFGNLAAMARMGHYNRQMAIFSFWTYGMDRRLMLTSLDALETIRDVGMWKGFRSMVEPGYVQGLLEESDLREYWDRILVPPQVQDWALLRLTQSREKFLAKEAASAALGTRDLTKADWTTAFVLGNIDQAAYEAKLASLGYDPDEIAVLVKNAESRIKTEKAATCKHLPLSDYELAHRNSIRSLQQVLDRMAGEYCPDDIDLESQLLQIDDLTTEAPAKERDLAASTVTTAFVESVRTRDETIAYLVKLGYDLQEIDTLMGVADIKKEAYDAKKARDDALAEAKAAKDALAEARAGLKRLPLSDYEKCWQYNLIQDTDVLARMEGEYNPYDIGLEKMMMAAGIARKG